jgi:nucleotide-binding universal stress UspA family protein
MIVPSYEWSGNALNGLSPEQIEAVQAHARDYLERIAKKLDVPSSSVQKVVAFNVPASNAILAEAGNGKTCLVALGTHGRGGWKRFLLGSVADKVIRGASVPVLVSRSPAQ